MSDEWKLGLAAHWISSGGVVAYPTEAVFGLGCDPRNLSAVERLLALKQRPVEKGLILIAAEWQQLQPWLQTIPASWKKRLNATWPGPTTWLVPARKDCPRQLRGKHRTLAVRITAHPPARALCAKLDSAIVSTSANTSGRRPAKSLLQVRLQFGNRVDYILGGKLGEHERPTEIRDLATGRVTRY